MNFVLDDVYHINFQIGQRVVFIIEENYAIGIITNYFDNLYQFQLMCYYNRSEGINPTNVLTGVIGLDGNVKYITENNIQYNKFSMNVLNPDLAIPDKLNLLESIQYVVNKSI